MHTFFFFFWTCSAALVAVSNTSLTPSLLLAEHSRYANALIFSAIVRPSSGLTGSCFILPNSFIVLLSFLKSYKEYHVFIKLNYSLGSRKGERVPLNHYLLTYLFVSYKDDGYIWTKVLYFWCPFFWYVFE